MTVFFTSDPHIGHHFVARLRWERAHPDIPRPSDGHVQKWHESVIRQNWESVVHPEDVVWGLGDLCLGGREAMAYALDFFKSLPGDKHWILGNHCKGHPRHRDAHKFLDMYLPVFGVPQQSARRKVAMPDGSSRNVMLSHFPYWGDRDEEDRDQQWRLRDMGDWLLHGHLHSNEPMRTDPVTGTVPKMIDVGLDAWNLTPASLEQVIELMSEHERELVGV